MTAITTTTNKRVHFVPENPTVFEIESYKDFSAKEVINTWYQRPWLVEVGKKRSKAAYKWTASKPSGLYLRGLEQFTKEGKKRFKRNVKDCIATVMDEQEIQWEIEEDDYDKFGVLSREVTRHCVAAALLRAEGDMLQAQTAYQSMERPKTQKPRRTSLSKEPMIMLDDQTTECSDLSSADDGGLDSFHSEDGTRDKTGWIVELEQVPLPSTHKLQPQPQPLPFTKKQKDFLSPRQTRAKIDAMRLKIMEISDVLYTMKV